jgi:hypothetical protein
VTLKKVRSCMNDTIPRYTVSYLRIALIIVRQLAVVLSSVNPSASVESSVTSIMSSSFITPPLDGTLLWRCWNGPFISSRRFRHSSASIPYSRNTLSLTINGTNTVLSSSFYAHSKMPARSSRLRSAPELTKCFLLRIFVRSDR